MTKLKDLEAALGKNADLVEFVVTEKELLLKPKEFLKPTIFKEIATVVKDHGGSYMRKENGGPHFRIDEKPKPQKPAESFGSARCPHCGEKFSFKVTA